MGTNIGWPEAFGFSISGGAPVVIRSVEDGGSAQAAGLQPGDVITELDGEDVQTLSLEQVTTPLSTLLSTVLHPLSLCYLQGGLKSKKISKSSSKFSCHFENSTVQNTKR